MEHTQTITQYCYILINMCVMCDVCVQMTRWHSGVR